MLILRDILQFPARIYSKLVYKFFPGHRPLKVLLRDFLRFPARIWFKFVRKVVK